MSLGTILNNPEVNVKGGRGVSRVLTKVKVRLITEGGR